MTNYKEEGYTCDGSIRGRIRMNDNAIRPIDALPQDGTKVTAKLKTGEILTGCWYHDKPRKSFYKYKTGCFSVGAVEWWVREEN